MLSTFLVSESGDNVKDIGLDERKMDRDEALSFLHRDEEDSFFIPVQGFSEATRHADLSTRLF
jgi:hypothetical protein